MPVDMGVTEVIERMEARRDDDDKRRSNKSVREKTDSAADRKVLELKICERCGGLWLRPAGSRWIYCGPCKRKVDSLPAVRQRPSRAKVKGAPVKGSERVQ